MLSKYNISQYIPYIKLDLLLKELGLQITRITDKEIQAHCPNPQHEDSTPSFFLNKQTGLFNCFGCGFSGSLLKLVKFLGNFKEDYEACSYIQHFLQEGTSESIDNLIPLKKRELNGIPKVSNRQVETNIDKKIGIHRIKLPEGYIRHAPEALWYLQYKGLDVNLIKENFEFGFCHIGRYKGRIVFPVYFNKTLVMVQGRIITEGIKPKDLFNAGFKKQYIYNYDNLQRNKFLIVTESIFDVFRLYPYYQNVTAIFGSRLIAEQAEMLLSISKEIGIMPDPDSGFKPFLETTLKYLYHKASLYISTFNKSNLLISINTFQPMEQYISQNWRYLNYDHLIPK